MPKKNKASSKPSWYSIKNAAGGDPVTILIYDEIGLWGITAEEFVNQLNGIDAEEIDLRINSPGGSVFEGMAIYNALRRHKAKISTYVDGLAASMGSVIALAGDEVNMAENAYYMIHNPWGGCWGEAKDMRKYADRLDEMREQIANIYQAKTGLDRDAILQAMDDETWYTGKTAQDAGFVDNLTETLDAAACYHGTDAVGRFGKAPITIERASVQQDPPQPERPIRLIAAKLDLLRATDNL
ncbi:head maturation protease, ClpP-related [Vibrio parahaemolyticus]|uniref:head maturation protease, ClpP-related n=1 Tax=Vibrio parahaemolyticus TaxID=670 RepID=UPI00146F74D0|nr:head maturation protease, ClpP-related [Vibrio parahaemolyticus]MDF4554914.1 Clp protease ClpP [Vibrio parahaemolyticus]MDF5352797.1 Clp protease ClpP [Vibrio parahaemolyticus]MDF5368248.1 Clp protease ClpP [Vibrio parahaemolyticus]MDG2771230.1 Clp protease ClpP [Vibrio parahaemolyticus]MDG2826660.1 Clp protease ClpP [Vibrio parahaemolyticus]